MAGTPKKPTLTGRIKAAAAGAVRGFTSGVGWEITQSSRKRRAFSLIAGLLASADRHLTKHTLGQLREICRMHDRQSSLFSGIIDRALDNIFGASFDFVPTTGDAELNKKVKQYITARMEKENCDASGVRDFAGLAKTAMRAVWTDGDCLLVKKKDGRLLALEAEQIVTPTDSGAERVVLGVALDEMGGHSGYYVKQRKGRGDYGMSEREPSTVRVKAANAIMPAFRKRFGQTRGVPFLACILGMFDRTNNYLDYESLAAEINALMGWKIKKEEAEEPLAGTADNEESETFEKLQKMEPGMIFDLQPGEDVDMIGSQRPGDNFESYLITCCRIIGVGVGFPLELMMLDFSRTNYSSARAALGEARRTFRIWQRFAAQHICLPWYRWQISRAVASGLLPARPEIYKTRCQWPAWEYIDPYKEAMGNKIAIETHTKSISQCIRETGDEPDEVFDEIADDRKKLAERGVPLTDAREKSQRMENIARAVRAGVPVGVGEARISLDLEAEEPSENLLRFNDQDILQYHIESGVLTINEARARLRLPPVPWGDVPVRKAGVAPVDTTAGRETETEPEKQEKDKDEE